MKLAWLILGEGLGQDAKGALTLIGLNQNVFIAGRYPNQTKRAVVLHVEDGGMPEQGHVRVTFNVRAPSGAVVLAQSTEVELGERNLPELPGQFDIPAEFVLSVETPGTYEISADVSFPDGSKESASVDLFAIRPPS